MRNNNLKKTKCLNGQQSEIVNQLLQNYFSETSYKDISDELTILFQDHINYKLLEYGEKDPGIGVKRMAELHWSLNQLSRLLRDLDEVIKDRFALPENQSAIDLVFTVENHSMDDGSISSIRKGDRLQCEAIDIESLESGYVCLFELANGSREVMLLAAIDKEKQMVITQERNPISRTIYNFHDIKQIYLVVSNQGAS